MKKVDNYNYKKIIYYSDVIQCTRDYHSSTKVPWKKKERSLEKGMQYYEENKERQHKTAEDRFKVLSEEKENVVKN